MADGRTKGSLLKYDVPVLAGNSDAKKKPKGSLPLGHPGEMLTRDVLNSILPPREFKNDTGDDLIQFVSTTPAARSDVVKLQHLLDSTLQQRKAREGGVCPIRSEIYAQCFDEIIRQVTIDCSARGLLLVRVRNEMRTTIDSYRSLYESAITWGMRKAMQLEQEKDDRTAENAALKAQVEALRAKNEELQAKMIDIAKREEDYKAQREKEHAEETARLKRQTLQLKAQLEQTLTAKPN
jgi:dynein light intermediate chain